MTWESEKISEFFSDSHVNDFGGPFFFHFRERSPSEIIKGYRQKIQIPKLSSTILFFLSQQSVKR